MTILSAKQHRPYRTKSNIDLEADRGWWLQEKQKIGPEGHPYFAEFRLAEIEREQAFRRRP